MATSETQSASGSQTQTESTAGRFTAVNGTAAVTSNGPLRRASEDRLNGQPRITPPGQEKLTITTTNTPREDWSQPPATNGERPANASGPQYPQSTMTYSEPSENSHKRKRSGSTDRQSSSTSSYHSHGLPKNSPGTAHPDSGLGAELETPREGPTRNGTNAEGRDHYGQQGPAQYGEENREAGNPWYPQQSHEARPGFENNLNSGQAQQMHSEEQLRENLQRELQRDSQQNPNMNSYGESYSPGDQENRNSAPYEYYNQDGTMTSVQLQADMKKRKRNFSNRTKTGCMTCRKRKKKCDEQRPECKSF